MTLQHRYIRILLIGFDIILNLKAIRNLIFNYVIYEAIRDMIMELQNYSTINCHLPAINWTKLEAKVVAA